MLTEGLHDSVGALAEQMPADQSEPWFAGCVVAGTALSAPPIVVIGAHIAGQQRKRRIVNARSRSEQSRHDRILDAATEVFSQQSASEATLQMVADSAGVSVGLVQHHFGSKDGLIAAVDAHAMTVIGAAMAQPLPESPTDAVLELGRRVGSLLSDHRAVVDYLARLLVDGTSTGAAFFDATVTIVVGHWQHLAEIGVTREGLDLVWAALNPTILVFGGVILRRHIDRHLPEPLWAPEQLRRWQESVNTLLRYGQFRP